MAGEHADRMAGAETELLDEATVVDYLAERGLVEPGPAVVELLGGGVSNVVLAVDHARRRIVVKQALPRLRVADEWTAPTSRALTEAAALRLAGVLTAGNVPAVLDRDDRRQVLVIQRSPRTWHDWKNLLLKGVVDGGVAARLGEILATWHAATRDLARLPDRILGGADAFEQLRVDPFYRTIARRAPELAGDVLATVNRMLETRTCLVHGDFSPKNVLTPPVTGRSRDVWVIDFEVAHAGDPAFDLAFMLCHLTLKSLHRPESAPDYDRCSEAFATTYAVNAGTALTPDWQYVMRHVGCLVLARVRGKSPADYLTAAQQDMAWRLGSDLVTDPPKSVGGLAARRHRLAR